MKRSVPLAMLAVGLTLFALSSMYFLRGRLLSPGSDGTSSYCATPSISVCGYLVNTRVYRTVQATSGGPQAGTVGTVMCGYFSQAFQKDGVCWDGFVQGGNNVFSCAASCSTQTCHPDGVAFVPCNELACLDVNGNATRVCEDEIMKSTPKAPKDYRPDMDDGIGQYDPKATQKLICAAIDYLDHKALGTVGLFRVNANLATVRELLIQHRIGRTVDVNACDDPHVIAAILVQLLRDRDPPALDFNRVNACDLPKDGMGPASTIVPSLRGLFVTASEEDITVCNKLCSVVSKLCQGQSSQLSSTSGAAASTAASLASVIGPSLCRPPGSAYMSIRHKQALPKIRDVVKAMFLHAAAVFNNLHASSPATQAAALSSKLSLPAPGPVSTSRPSSDDESGYESPPYFTGSSRGPLGTPKHISKGSTGLSPPSSSPLSPSIQHKQTSYLNPSVHKAVDALSFFCVRDFVSSTPSSPLGRSLVTDIHSGVSSLTSTGSSLTTNEGKLSEDGGCPNPYCPVRQSVDVKPSAEFEVTAAQLAHGSGDASNDSWLSHDTLPGLLVYSLTQGWTSQTNVLGGVSVDCDSLSSSLDSVHLSAAPVLSPSMSRRLDAKRARQLGGPEPRTPPPNDLLTTEGGIAVSSGVHHGKEDEGLEGLGVTVNSPVSESVHRQRPSAMDRRAQIAKCKSLRNVIRDFENTFTTEHGHQPRGPERTPLRNVYLQYRRLKQGVRENAATHIQMVYRGHLVRKRHGKIYASPTSRSVGSTGIRTSTASSESKLDAPSAKAFDSIDTNPATDAVATVVPPATHPAQVPTASVTATTTQLREEKSQLKHRLRQFDIDFKAKHGRLPSKADKEVIRHLYKRYHDVKALLLGMEAAGSSSSTVPPHPTAGTPAATPTATSGDEGSSELPESIRQLQREKRNLQHHLRKFEEEFLKTHGRKVKYQKDIQPVAEDYQRYKEIKTALAAYKQ